MTFTFIGAGSRADFELFGRLRQRRVLPGRRNPGGRTAAAMVPGTTDALSALFATPPASTLPDSLGTIAAPTLIIWGADDTRDPVESGARTCRAALAGSSVEIVAGAGHRPHLEDPRSHGCADLGVPGSS